MYSRFLLFVSLIFIRYGCRRPHTAIAVPSGDDRQNGIFVTRSLDAGQIFLGQTTNLTALVRYCTCNKSSVHAFDTQVYFSMKE